MQGNYSVWNDARIVQLTALWARRDYSATTIGVAMGMSRNAILGKAFRLKLPPRKPLASAAKGPRMFVMPRAIKPPPVRPPPPSNKLGIVRTPIGANAISPDTGEYLTYRRRRAPKMTKTELRAELTQAVINTGGVR